MTDLIKEAFGVVGPCQGGEFNETNFFWKSLIMMFGPFAVQLGKWRACLTYVNSTKIASLDEIRYNLSIQWKNT